MMKFGDRIRRLEKPMPKAKSKTRNRCVYQDDYGQQCRKNGVVETDYFGERSIYGDRVYWVKVYFCKGHYEQV